MGETHTREAQKKLTAIAIMQTLGDWDKREEAKRTTGLADLGNDITDLLLIAASSPNRRFRRSIVTALAEIADPRATEHLIRALDDDYTHVRRKALAGLVGIGEPAVDRLIEAADSDQTRIRRYAIMCLGHIGAARAKPVILEALHDSEEEVRRQAVRALKEHATMDDLDALKQFLREAQPRYAIEAIEILEALGQTAVEALGTMAKDEHNLAAAYFIAQQGDAAGRELLVQHMKAGGDDAPDAVDYLRELRDPRCVPHVIAQFHELTEWYGMFIAHELGAIGTDDAIAALIEALERDSHLIRRGAVRALGEAMPPAAIEPLITALEDADSKTRRLAAQALRDFGEAAVAPLERALAQTDTQDGRRRSILRRVLCEVKAAGKQPPTAPTT